MKTTLFVFRKRGLLIKHKKTLFFSTTKLQILNIRSENQAEEEDYASLFMNHLIKR